MLLRVARTGLGAMPFDTAQAEIFVSVHDARCIAASALKQG
jgi:hypothetical protein